MSVTYDPASEWLAAGALLGEGLSNAVNIVADTHKVIANRVERYTPEPLATFSRLHHAAVQTTYSAVSTVSRLAPATAADVGVALAADALKPLEQTAVGRPAARWANGIMGDRLSEQRPELAFRMSVRVHGRDVSGEALSSAHPNATGHIVVFLHGLTETEQCWSRGVATERQYPACLQRDLGITPLLVRYNSGLHISDNGRLLDELLEEVVESWPVEVESLSLVGHSMGGLVARSACIAAADRQWTRTLRAVVTLGTPHLGSPVEKLAHIADWMMARIPDAAPTGRILGLRSAGIRDLRFGSLTETGWAGEELLADPHEEIPTVPGVSHYWVAGSLTPNRPLSHLLGDGLVRARSAQGRGRKRAAHMDDGAHVAGVGHMRLVADEEVYNLLLRWLG